MNNLICQAIKEMRKVRISYKGGTRVIEPHAFGYDTQRKRKLRAYQVSGYSESRNTQGWKLLDVDDRRVAEHRRLDWKGPRRFLLHGDSCRL